MFYDRLSHIDTDTYLGQSFYLITFLYIILNAILIALNTLCPFCIEYSVYFIVTGTSTYFRFFLLISSIISDACSILSCFISIFSAAFLDNALKPLCVSVNFIPDISHVNNIPPFNMILFTNGVLLF